MFIVQNILHKASGVAGVFLGVALVLCAGCSTPTTGRVRDVHLLYAGTPEQREITSAKEFGPFYEQVVTGSGSKRTSYRPFFGTTITADDGNAMRREVLWPIYDSNYRNGSLTWRFLLWFGVDADTDDPESYNRLWAFPLWFQGQTKAGENYAALFPVYGTIRDMFWERIHFLAFPLWVDYDRNGNHTLSVLWPIFSRTTGKSLSGFKVFPLYGQMARKSGDKTRFVLWPLWTSGTYTNRSPGYSWMLFPVMGRVNRASESSWIFLPPFFNFTHGQGKMKDYRKLNCPWPFVKIADTETLHKRYYLPFWGHVYDNAGKYDSCSVMWPFYNSRYAERARIRDRSRTLFPLFHWSEAMTDANQDGVFDTEVETYWRLWPLLSHRSDPENDFLRIPDLSLSKRLGPIERNFLGMFTFYTRGHSTKTHRVDHEALWGFFRRGYGEAYSSFRVWPVYERKRDAGKWNWSVLGGLLGRRGDAENAQWCYLWFFGGSEDDGKSKEAVK